MRNRFHYLIGTISLAFLTACGGIPKNTQEHEEALEPKETNNHPITYLTDEKRAELLDAAEQTSFQMQYNMDQISRFTQIAAKLAMLGIIEKSTCSLVLGDEAKELIGDIRKSFEASVSYEVKLNGETESGKNKRLRSMDEKIGFIAVDTKLVSLGCKLS